ncbi:MAG: polysaccharide deacetylase family protein [Chitinophagaceae bacterium]|nr:MAG: polysaccharide deacetylase family protein [Chitinophagaceae bacterium]
MKNYFIKTPWWLKKIYPAYIWDVPTKEKIVYLTFDDGPHAVATPFVLDELKKAGATATFFCIGKNVLQEPVLYRRILDEGHSVGNHTFNHLNGWKTANDVYLKDVAEAGKHIDSDMFRPPYGRIGRFQASALANALKKPAVKVVMWDVLSGDFDTTLSGEACLKNIVLNIRPGSIVIMHDSQKAWERLSYLLPLLLVYLREQGYAIKKL